MARYVYRPNHPMSDALGMVDSSVAGPKHTSDSAVHVITDEMDATKHMADGRMYTSKAKFRQATKAAGCIEVGNETETLLRPRKPAQLSRQDRREAIRKAIAQLR